jgi:hypothetical protein
MGEGPSKQMLECLWLKAVLVLKVLQKSGYFERERERERENESYLFVLPQDSPWSTPSSIQDAPT